jgi:hypothetical protein
MIICALFDADGRHPAFYVVGQNCDTPPAGSVEITQVQRDAWVAKPDAFRWDGVGIVAYVPPMDLVAYAKTARDRHEEAGITVSGVPIATDDRSKTLVLGARRRVEKDQSLVTKWSAADGSVYPLDARTIIAVSDAIGDFVAELFEAYADIMADLAVDKITTPQEIDARYGRLNVAF